MKERHKISSMDIKTHLNNLRKNPKFTQDMAQLVESDLQYGLTIAETEEYTGRKFDAAQMRVYSKCLRIGCDNETKAVLAKEDLSGEQMMVALEFYERGVPLSVIAEVTGNRETTAYAMKRCFQNVVDKTLETQKISDKDMEYAKELLEQMKEVVAKIDYQEKRYDALSEKLKEMQTDKEDTKVQNHLLEKLGENEMLLEQQQNQINEGRVIAAKLRQELEQVRKEKKSLEKNAEEQKNKQMNMSPQKENENVLLPEKTAGQMNPRNPGMEYKAVMLDKDGTVVSLIPEEYQKRRKENYALSALFSRFRYKKKIDIVRLVAEKNLEPKQLIQIRVAIEKGLNNKQLLVLINSRLPAEQMEEIIRIAEFENRQGV